MAFVKFVIFLFAEYSVSPPFHILDSQLSSLVPKIPQFPQIIDVPFLKPHAGHGARQN